MDAVNLQQCYDRRQTFRHERDQNGDSERDGLRTLALVHRSDSDDEENNGKDDSDRGDHHDEARTRSGSESLL